MVHVEEEVWEGVTPTEFSIIKAYIDLMDEKPYSKIKVKEIVDRCGIARSTFYVYYQDALDVLEKIEQNLLSRCRLYSHDEAVKYAATEVDPQFAAMVHWFEECLCSRNTLRALFGPNGDPYFGKRLCNNLRESFQEMMDDDAAPNTKLRRLFVELQTDAYFGLMQYVVSMEDDDELVTAYEMAWVANSTRKAFGHHLLDNVDVPEEKRSEQEKE